MMITFKSAASGGVMMFGKDGRQMLRLLGKDADAAMGVVTVEQLPAAIAALKGAIEDDKGCAEDLPEPGEDADGRPNRRVKLVQRALPLVKLLERSLADEATVTWGV